MNKFYKFVFKRSNVEIIDQFLSLWNASLFYFLDDVPNSDRPQSLNPALRQHILIQKTVVMPDTCLACEKRIRFGKTALRCKECKSCCHPECQSMLPLPCVPIINTPNCKKTTGIVSDYTPAIAPMIPSLVVRCVTEVEQRGLEELGIYRVPGSEKDVKGKNYNGIV